MGIFEQHHLDKLDKDQIEQLQQKQHELVLIRRERRIPGHTMFSYNIETGEIKIAPLQYSRDVHLLSGEPVEKPKLVIERNCVYRQALNKKNFIKILKREGIYNYGK